MLTTRRGDMEHQIVGAGASRPRPYSYREATTAAVPGSVSKKQTCCVADVCDAACYML